MQEPRAELPIFEVTINPDDLSSGVYATSLVAEPAILTGFVALSAAERVKLSADAARQTLTGPFVIPNQLIYRNVNGREFYIRYSEAVIRQMSERFAKANYNRNVTHQHLRPLQSSTVTESWVVEDSAKDKSAALGYELPKGTWMLTVKVDDPAYWSEQVLQGKVTGFSLEGLFDLVETGETAKLSQEKQETTSRGEKIDSKTNKKMNKKSIFSELARYLRGTSDKIEQEVAKLEEVSYTLADGTVIVTEEGVAEVVDEAGMVIGHLRFEPIAAEEPMAPEAPSESGAPVESPAAVTASVATASVSTASVEQSAEIAELKEAMKLIMSELREMKGAKAAPAKIEQRLTDTVKVAPSKDDFRAVMLEFVKPKSK